MRIIFYDNAEKEWLLFNKETGKTEAALPEEIDAQIDSIINYLRDCAPPRDDIVVSDGLSKSVQAIYKLLSYFGVSMSETKLVSLLYLCDWRHCLTNNRQITEIQWARKLGATPVIENQSSDFWAPVAKLELVNNVQLVELLEDDIEITLEQSELDAITHCCKSCEKMDALEFTRLICGTFPLLTANNFEILDLVNKSKIYKLEGHWRPWVTYE